MMETSKGVAMRKQALGNKGALALSLEGELRTHLLVDAVDSVLEQKCSNEPAADNLCFPYSCWVGRGKSIRCWTWPHSGTARMGAK
mmetsp:Transcript_26803/g.68905  ORF Transcript_26803/g.68905 Transcript_26803/m.68905 type:complete len:86 (+) Transcript_26803:927-1184(+)